MGGFVIYGWGLSYLGGICQMWGGLSYMGGVCQIWAPIHYGTVMKYVANNFRMVFLGVCQFYQYGRDISPYLTNPNDKPLPNIL